MKLDDTWRFHRYNRPPRDPAAAEARDHRDARLLVCPRDDIGQRDRVSRHREIQHGHGLYREPCGCRRIPLAIAYSSLLIIFMLVVVLAIQILVGERKIGRRQVAGNAPAPAPVAVGR